MKSIANSTRFRTILSRTCAAALLLTTGSALAQTSGTATPEVSVNWTTAGWTNLSGPGLYPDGGGVATISSVVNTTIGSHPTNRTITLDTSVSGGSWTNSNALEIGNVGTGDLTVNGGSISNTVGSLGAGADAIGTVEMNAGSWTNSDELRVGDSGHGMYAPRNGR